MLVTTFFSTNIGLIKHFYILKEEEALQEASIPYRFAIELQICMDMLIFVL